MVSLRLFFTKFQAVCLAPHYVTETLLARNAFHHFASPKNQAKESLVFLYARLVHQII